MVLKFHIILKIPWCRVAVFMHLIKGRVLRSCQEKKKRASEWQALFGVQSYKSDKDD